MAEFVINYLAIVLAAASSIVLGFVWYHPSVFGKQWVKLIGWSTGQLKIMKKDVTLAYTLTIIASVIMALVLAQFIAYFEDETFTDGMITGFWLWLGFVATTSLGSLLWEGKSFKLYLLNNGYYLLSILLMGGILAVM